MARRPIRMVTFLLVGSLSIACAGGGASPAVPSGSAEPAATSASCVSPSMTASARASEPSQGGASTAAPTGWQVTDIPGAEHIASTPGRVAAVADGFLAIGERQCTRKTTDPTEIDACYGLAWHSTSGETWTRIEPSPAIEVGDRLSTSGPLPGWVALDGGSAGAILVGYRLEQERTPRSGPTAWSVSATRPFIPVPDPAFTGARFADVVVTDAGALIVGTVVRLTGSLADSPPPRAAAWWSDTGLGWTRADDGPWADIGGYIDTLEDPGYGGPLAAVHDKDGFLAVGSSCDAGGADCVAAVWRSVDGLTWERVEVPPLDGRLHAVAPLADGVVALGKGPQCGDGCATTVLVGSPARGWETTTLDEARALEAIATLPGGVLAVGAPETSGPTAWWSTDGIDWSAVADLPTVDGVSGVRAIDVASDGQRVVIVGWSEPSTGFAVTGVVTP